MLIDKSNTVAVNDVVVLRLVNGEELIGKVLELTNDAITITKPVILQMQMISPKEAGIAFAPFMVGADESGKYNIKLDKLIVAPMKARKDISANYIKQTSSIEIPTSGLIV